MPYTQVEKYTACFGDTPIGFFTKPGLTNWQLLASSTQLFAKQVIIKPADSILLYGCHLGAMACFLASQYPSAKIRITDHNSTCLEMTRMTLAANHVESVEILSGIDLPEELRGNLNVIFIQLPKGRMLARRWLTQAFHGLADGGKLYLAGANQTGIQSVRRDGHELFGNSQILGYKKGNRIASFTKMAEGNARPDWASLPGIASSSWVEFNVSIHGHNFQIHSLPGIFSFDHLDEGTMMLLEAVNIAPLSRVLDVGCGYGIIGLYAATVGATSVHFVDNDLLAVASCEETLRINGIANACVYTSDLLQAAPLIQYDLILSNPPFHAGHTVDYQIADELIRQSYEKLSFNGQLILVANRFIRYNQLIKGIFGNVVTLTESRKFRVLAGQKSGLQQGDELEIR